MPDAAASVALGCDGAVVVSEAPVDRSQPASRNMETRAIRVGSKGLMVMALTAVQLGLEVCFRARFRPSLARG